MRLSIENVVKHFGGVTVLDGVSVEVEPGSVTGLIGPNGSGKSTLFDVVTGFVPMDSGHVELDQARLDSLRPHVLAARGLVRTFQVPRVTRRMTLLENLMVVPRRGEGESVVRLLSPARVGRVRRDERARLERSHAMLARLGLERLANDYADVLSGGQLKLLSIGIALMSDPDVLLLDEPTAGVNAVLIEPILDLVRQRRERGQTTLVIEHNLSIVAEVCTTIYVLHAGEIIAHGPLSALQEDERVIDAYLGRTEARLG
jgi:ABC-type branched-subunit amino acid transport system ATPase component